MCAQYWVVLQPLKKCWNLTIKTSNTLLKAGEQEETVKVETMAQKSTQVQEEMGHSGKKWTQYQLTHVPAS